MAKPHSVKPINTLTHGKQVQPDTEGVWGVLRTECCRLGAERHGQSDLRLEREREGWEKSIHCFGLARCRLIRSEALRNVLNYLWLWMAHLSDYHHTARGISSKERRLTAEATRAHANIPSLLHSPRALTTCKSVWDVNIYGWRSHVSQIPKPVWCSLSIFGLIMKELWGKHARLCNVNRVSSHYRIYLSS